MSVNLHPLARTTPRTRAEIKSEAPSLSHQALARRYGVTAPTVRKWRERDSTADRSHRPHTLHGTLTPAQEMVAMEIRRALCCGCRWMTYGWWSVSFSIPKSRVPVWRVA